MSHRVMLCFGAIWLLALVAWSPVSVLDTNSIPITPENAGQVKQLAMLGRGTVSDLKAVALSPDKTLVASAAFDGRIHIWSIVTQAEVRTLQGNKRPALSLAFSPDGTLLASGSMDGSVRLWNIGSGVLQTALYGHSDLVESLAFSPDGKLLASGGFDRAIWL